MNIEQQRRLLADFGKLRGVGLYIVEFLGCCHTAVSLGELMRELQEVLPAVAGRKLGRGEITPAVTRLLERDFITEEYQRVELGAPVYEAAVRRAVESGRFEDYQVSSFVRSTDYFKSGWDCFNVPQIEQRLRVALYRGEWEAVPYWLAQLARQMKQSRFDELVPMARLLCYSENLSWLAGGPAEFLVPRLVDAMEQTQLRHDGLFGLVEPLYQLIQDQDFVMQLDGGYGAAEMQQLMLLWVGECWLSGVLDREGEMLDAVLAELTGYHKDAALAVVAFGGNEIERAAGLADDALAGLRKETRRKRLFFNNIVGMVFLYAGLRENSPQRLSSLKILFEDIKARTNKSGYQRAMGHLAFVVTARLAPDKINIDEFYVPWPHDMDYYAQILAESMGKALYDSALVADNDRAIGRLENVEQALRGTPHGQLYANVVHLLAHVSEPSVEPEVLDAVRASSFDFDGRGSAGDWKFVLHHLSQIAATQGNGTDSAPTAGEARLVFRLVENPARHSFDVHPMLQKQRKQGGWTKGRPFKPEKRLDSEAGSYGMTAADEQVLKLLEADAARCEKSGFNSWQQQNHNDALYALAGHPHVFVGHGEQLIPVEIKTGRPQFEVRESAGKLSLQMEPASSCDKGYWVERRTANLVEVIMLDAAQQEAQLALGKSGVLIPRHAKADVARAVAKMDALAEVHSHVQDIGKRSETVDAQAGLVLRILPLLDGLSVQFMVAPMGESGPSFVPGQGQVNVFATVNDQKCTTTRNLKRELAQLDELLMALGLYYSDGRTGFGHDSGHGNDSAERDDGMYQFGNLGAALEFLSELENVRVGGAPVPFAVEWPRGVKLSCSRTLFPEDLHLSINRQRKWLAVDGKVSVDNDTVYRLAEVMDAAPGPGSGFVRLKDGQFMRLSKSLKKYLTHVGGIGETQENGEIRAPLNAAMAVKKLEEEAGSTKTNKAWDKSMETMEAALQMQSKVPRQVRATLRDYQVEGFRWLHRLSILGLGACLADDMGLGKTLQALTLICTRLQQKPAKGNVLIVAPVSVIPNWMTEAARFVPALKMVLYSGSGRKRLRDDLAPGEVLVTSYGLLQRDGAKLAKIPFDTVVLDEAQFIKNKDSARAKAAFKLDAEFKMVTTGTPVENRLSELWSIFNFINPGLLTDHRSFVDTYEKTVQQMGLNYGMADLRWQVRPFVLRRTKEDTLDELPPKTEIVRYCEMGPDEAAFYELQRQRALESLKTAESKEQVIRLITSLTRLRQTACHPKLVAPNMELDSAKLACLKEILFELKEGNHQALVFSQFVKYLSLVRNWLDAQGYSYQYIDGSSTAKQRIAAVENFQAGESDLFLISTRAGGFGLNLTAADYVVHLDPWWNPAVEDQASDRVHRIGQTRPVTIYKLITKGTVEEKVMQIHGDKRALAQELLEGSDAVGRMEMRDLMELL